MAHSRESTILLYYGATPRDLNPQRPRFWDSTSLKYLDHPTSVCLVRLHTDIGDRLLENKKEAQRLAESIQTVEHVIRLFDPSFNVRRIAASRRYKGQRLDPDEARSYPAPLDVFREAKAPLTAREIAEAMLVAKDPRDDASPKAVRSPIASVQTSLANRGEQTVIRVGARYSIAVEVSVIC
jgi:hypothetical protein